MTEQLGPPDRSRFPTLHERHLRRLPAGETIVRIYESAGRYGTVWNAFRTWGPTRSRFDHHPEPPGEHPRHAIMYAAVPATWLPRGGAPATDVALAETFRDRGVIEMSRNRPCLAIFHCTRDLRLLDVSDTAWITQAGGNAAICSGPRAVSREWARAIWRHYGASLDGIAYASSNVPSGRAVALWQTARTAVPGEPDLNRDLATPDLRSLLERAATRLRLDLA